MEKIAPSELADWLMGHGQHFVTSAEVAELVGVNQQAVSASLERAREAHKLVSVTKGGWVPVPPEYRQAGAPPPIHYIDRLMGHLGHPYYVGFLSAAALHGASHQAPMVLQVVSTARLRDRRIGVSRLQFIQRSTITDRPTTQRNVPTGRVWVSTPEATLFDLVSEPRLGGGLSNVATVIGELLIEGQLTTGALVAVARIYPTTVTQRAGHLIELMAREVGVEIDLETLAVLVAGADADHTLLAPGRTPVGHRDERWRVLVNTAIEHDL